MYSPASITALIPTLHRPAGLRRVLKSLRDTAPEVKIVVAADPDDMQAVEIASEFNADFVLCQPPRGGCAAAWNQALAASPDDDIYVIAADDCVFQRGWLKIALAALDKLGGSGLVAFQSGDRKKFGDHYMMTRDFIIQHHGGVAAIPYYKAWCVDDEAQYRAERAGKWIKAGGAVVTHTKAHDETWKLNESRIEPSRRIYNARRAANWPDDFEPVIR